MFPTVTGVISYPYEYIGLCNECLRRSHTRVCRRSNDEPATPHHVLATDIHKELVQTEWENAADVTYGVTLHLNFPPTFLLSHFSAIASVGGGLPADCPEA